MSDGNWSWQFRTPAKRTYDGLDEHAQNRITDKLDEIVTDQWRDPDDYLDPLTGAPYSKLRIGQFRLGAERDHSERVLDIIRSNTVVARTKLTTIDPDFADPHSS